MLRACCPSGKAMQPAGSARFSALALQLLPRLVWPLAWLQVSPLA